MLIREKVKLGHIATVWMSGDWNISDVGTKAIDVPTTERLTPLLCGFGELPIPAETKILFGPVVLLILPRWSELDFEHIFQRYRRRADPLVSDLSCRVSIGHDLQPDERHHFRTQ